MDEPVSQDLLREEYEQIKGALPEDWEGLLKKVNTSGHREGSWIITRDAETLCVTGVKSDFRSLFTIKAGLEVDV